MRVALLAAALCLLAPAAAQDQLPLCPWESLTEAITTTVTYTLTADCRMTKRLGVSGTAGILTINGAGYTIDGASLRSVDSLFNVSGTMTLNNVTTVGGGASGSGAIGVGGPGTVSINNSTLSRSYWTAVSAGGGTAATVTLTNVLIVDATGSYSNINLSGAAIETSGISNVTANNLVLRNSLDGNAAINALVSNTETSSITMTGCFTADGVWPQVFAGNVIRTAVTGPCSGTIGNGDSAARQYRQPAVSGCGLPVNGGFVQRDVTYNLRSNCVATSALYIPSGVSVTVNGNGFTITQNGALNIFAFAGSLTLRDMIITGVRPVIGFLRGTLLVETSAFRGNTAATALVDASATFDRVIFEDNTVTNNASALLVLYSAQATLRDTIFRNNSGGNAAIYAALPRSGGQPSVTFEGCLTLSNNTPTTAVQSQATPSFFVVNQTGACPDESLIGPPPPRPTPPESAAAQARAQRPPATGPIWHTCPLLEPEVVVTDLTGSTQCQLVEGDQIGIVSLLEAGVVDAVDVWSWVGKGTQVCFQASGHGIVFLDAANSPRVPEALPAYREDSMTCADIDGAGTVVLTRSQPRNVSPISVSLATKAQEGKPLASCMVNLRDILNLREAPDGAVIEILPSNVTLTAFRRTPDWFYVDYHGQRGWVSAEYVNQSGDCG